MNYFIGDLHIGHVNCLDFDNRPFRTIEDHDGYIMEQWNKRVGPDDDVYVIGDISFRNATQTAAYYRLLNGRKHLIKGNHDDKYIKSPDVRQLFVEICDRKELFIDKNLSLILDHFPLCSFKNSHRGWIHLYGHVHDSFEAKMTDRHRMLMRELYHITYQDGKLIDGFRTFNVGAMTPGIDYVPRTLEEIEALIEESRKPGKLLTCEEKYLEFAKELDMIADSEDTYSMTDGGRRGRVVTNLND